MNLQNKINGYTVAIAAALKLDGHPDFMAATGFAETWMTANLASLRMRNGFGQLVFLPDVTPANLACWIARDARDNPLPAARAFAAAFDRAGGDRGKL